jgi:hypothetical protein
MGEHIFVDETKARGFILVAVRVDNRDVARLRRAMRGLLMPGQERIHFGKESNRRRKLILAELARHKIRFITVQSQERDLGLARKECLETLLHELVGTKVDAHIVIERDEGLIRQDTQVLAKFIRGQTNSGSLSYEFLAPRDDPGLWSADAIAWAIQRGGDWIRRISMHGDVHRKI